MKHILVSGLVNMETTVKVRQFPIPYYPIDYPFFGVNTAVSGVGYNVALALNTLGDRVTLRTLTGQDFPGDYVRRELSAAGLSTAYVSACLDTTPNSVVLYDGAGQRQIHCDLKDIQDRYFPLQENILEGVDLVAACSINFSRPLLAAARAAGKTIATDVHVLSNIYDDYNREFMEAADLLFLSDEGLGPDYGGFLAELSRVYGNELIILGRGSKGAAIYVTREQRLYTLPAAYAGPVENTVGAGDALFSGFLHFYSQGREPLDCLRRAQMFAAAKIRISGGARGFVTEAEVEDLLNRY